MRTTWILVLAMALMAASCSSDTSDGVASLSDPSEELTREIDDAVSDVDDQEALNVFAACMRDNGLESFEDPVVNADGSVDFGQGGGIEFDDRETLQSAFDACGDLLEGVSIAPGGGGFDVTEIEDQLVAFASCMRDEGIDMDDPDLSDFAPGGGQDGDATAGGPFGDLDLDDPDVQAALETCQAEFGFGPGGGGPGQG